MSRSRAVIIGMLSIFVAGYFGHRCYEWLTTGQLWASSRGNPGRYVTFAAEPVGLVIHLGSDILLMLLAIVGVLIAISAE